MQKPGPSQDRAVLAQSDALSAELDRADILVVAMPMYNFSVPTSFRAWVDLVCRDNVDGASRHIFWSASPKQTCGRCFNVEPYQMLYER